MQVEITISCHNKDKGTIEKLEHLEATCNPLRAKGIDDLEDVRKLEQKQYWFRMHELCDQIVTCLEEALKTNPEAPYDKWIKDGIPGLMKFQDVRRRNALHEMDEAGHLRILFVEDDEGKCLIRLKTIAF